LENGFKFFPSILASHAAIQAMLDVVTKHDVRAADISSITNETYETVKTHFSAKTVGTSMAARVSVPYCMAVAALDRHVGQAQLRQVAWPRPTWAICSHVSKSCPFPS
jgi:2-methylcitrate dehydratase PrpD